MKIVLIFPKLEKSKSYHYVPFSSLAVASRYLARGYEVEIYDERVEGEEILHRKLASADMVGVTVYTGYQTSRAYQLSKYIKKQYSGTPIFWGGPHASVLGDQVAASGIVDGVYKGHIDDGSNPIPWHLVDINKYINPETERFIYISSYGCVGICTFCATKERHKPTYLPLSKVEQDIDTLMAIHMFKECVFFDATLFTKPERAYAISQIMQKHNLSWICDARAIEIGRAENLDEIVGSGLKQITIGLESGSPLVIETMRKGRNHLDHFSKAAKKLAKYDLRMVSGVVFGTPGETVDDLQLTINFIKKIKDINPNFFVSSTFYRPLPGTVMADMCREYGYKEPQSLSEWAELSEQNHYSYNQWQNSPWIKDAEAYRKVYEEFRGKHLDLFV